MWPLYKMHMNATGVYIHSGQWPRGIKLKEAKEKGKKTEYHKAGTVPQKLL